MLLVFAFFLILLNGFFVAAEFALVKVRATQLDAAVQEGKPASQMARHVVTHLDGYLSATQLGITLASLGLGWVGEPALAEIMEPLFHQMGIHDPNVLHTTSFVVAFSIISFFHIVVGEIAPKSYAIAKPVDVSLFVAYPMRVFYVMFVPFLWVLNGSSNTLLRWMGVEPAGGGHGIAVTPEELYHIAAQSTAEGAISQGQGQLLTNVLAFSDHVAREIMVPRNRVVYVHADTTLDEALQRIQDSGHTRLPIVEGSLDKVIGILNQKDLIPLLRDGRKRVNMRSLVRPVFYVPENMPAQRLLLEFQRRRLHFAIVVDEYGGLSGIVTMEDALEELVGEIQDEFDRELQPIMPLAGGRYSVDGGLLLDDLARALEMELSEEVDADTIGGYIMEKLDRTAKPGDEVPLDGWLLRVRAMDRLRIGRVEVLPRDADPDSEDVT